MAAVTIAGVLGCGRQAAQKPADVLWDDATVDIGSASVSLTLGRPPSSPTPRFVVVFASGDGGLWGISEAVLDHFAEQGNWVAGFSSEDAFESVMSEPSGRPNYTAARDAFAAIVAQAKRAFNLPDETPIIASGMSRGASVVIAASGDPTLRPGIMGAVAIALTQEFDALTVREEAQQLPGVRFDEHGRIQTYPAIVRLGSIPLAIIQSTNDDYVPSAESRRLLGADTSTRRLYEVEAKNHEFDGGQSALMRDLDDAIKWIAGRR